MMFEELSKTVLVRSLGLIVLLKLCLNAAYCIYDYLLTRLRPQDIAAFGEWAAITGSTDGIGKAIAREIAKKGVNIILISRNETKLKNTAKEIESDFQIKTFCIQADFTDRNCYESIREGIKDKDIGILVNNVGILTEIGQQYTFLPEERLWNEIDVNCGAVAIMTRMVLPQMKAKKKGLIVNISSLSTLYGFPWFGLYSPSKSFMNMFSYNIQEEFDQYNIKVKCLIPGFVNTKLLDELKPFFNTLEKRYSFLMNFFPDASKYAQHAIGSFSSNSVLHTGYWAHTFMASLCWLLWLSFELRIRITSKFLRLLDSCLNSQNKRNGK